MSSTGAGSRLIAPMAYRPRGCAHTSISPVLLIPVLLIPARRVRLSVRRGLSRGPRGWVKTGCAARGLSRRHVLKGPARAGSVSSGQLSRCAPASHADALILQMPVLSSTPTLCGGHIHKHVGCNHAWVIFRGARRANGRTNTIISDDKNTIRSSTCALDPIPMRVRISTCMSNTKFLEAL